MTHILHRARFKFDYFGTFCHPTRPQLRDSVIHHIPEYPLDGLPLSRPEALVAELGEGVVEHGVAVCLARRRRRVEVRPAIGRGKFVLILRVHTCHFQAKVQRFGISVI